MFPVSISPESIVVCILVKIALGYTWYSQAMFGKAWRKLLGKKSNGIKMTPSIAFLSALTATIKVLATAVLVYWMGAFTWQAGLLVGLVMGVGIVAADNASAVIWEGKSLQLFLIDAGHAVIGFALSGIILAVMANPPL